MGTITLPNGRASSDFTFRVKLKDGGLFIDWTVLSDIKAYVYSNDQKALAGRCDVSIDQENHTILKCEYASTKPQYGGINSIVIRATYMGRKKTYDKPAVNIVARTSEVSGSVVLQDPVVDIEIVVEDVSSSILDNAIAAAIQAAEEAEHAAHLIPNQVLLDCEAATQEALEAARKVVTAEDLGEAVEDVNLEPNVQYVTQTLSTSQKAQARTNIGAGTSSFSGNYNDLTNKPTIPPLSNNLPADKASTTKGASAKDAYDAAHPAIATAIPSGGMKPNMFYNLGTLTGNVTFTLAEPEDATIVNHYFFSFTAGATAPTITWPSGIVGWASGVQPTITAMVYYEISILNGYAAFLDV